MGAMGIAQGLKTNRLMASIGMTEQLAEKGLMKGECGVWSMAGAEAHATNEAVAARLKPGPVTKHARKSFSASCQVMPCYRALWRF